MEQLDERTGGLLEPGLVPRLQEIGRLVAAQQETGRAIAQRIHGDHREYLLKVQRLVDQLTDERWIERERAERALIEVGGRARELLRERSQTGELLEERLRCRRILEELSAAGTEKEEREVQRLRGLTSAALYLQPAERLTRALLSAIGHTDPLVVEGAARALGVHGHGEHAAALRPLLARSSGRRRVALAAIARMAGEEPLAMCAELLRGGELTTTEVALLLRALRARQEPVVDARLLGAEGPLLAAAAELRLPEPAPAPAQVHVGLADGGALDGQFLGFTGDAVLVGAPVAGLDRVELAFGECERLEFAHPVAVQPQSSRFFLTQGSLVTGVLQGMDGDVVRLQSPVFGAVEIPRAGVQGIALDSALDRLIGASTANDRVRLRSGAMVDGRVRALTATDVEVERADGAVARHPLAEVAGILLRRPLQAQVDEELYTRLDLTSGDRILGHVVGANSSALAVVAPMLGSAVVPVGRLRQLELAVGGGALWGFTLIADYSDNRIVEVDEHGKEVFVMEDVLGAWDVECLDNGNFLITEFSVSRVQEVTREGELVWSFEDLRNPYDADRLANGNTLIADTFRGRVVEVDPSGAVVWTYDDGIRPFDADRLANGNTLIADVLKDRVLEVDPAGAIVWEKKDLPSVHDADRLPDGYTLITLRTLSQVIEVDRAGKVVFRLANLNAPSDADRLPNGNTIVAENAAVREFDRDGKLVWEKPMTWAVEVNRY